jgi:hypothetical protein
MGLDRVEDIERAPAVEKFVLAVQRSRKLEKET